MRLFLLMFLVVRSILKSCNFKLGEVAKDGEAGMRRGVMAARYGAGVVEVTAASVLSTLTHPAVEMSYGCPVDDSLCGEVIEGVDVSLVLRS